MKTYSGVSVSIEEPFAIITFDEVQLKLELLTKLALTLYQLEAEDRVKAIILTGRRNMFLSGADLKEFASLSNAEVARKFIQIPKTIMEQIYHCRKVTLAAINGYCIGGGLELALACDFRICVDQVMDFSQNAVPFIGLPEVSLGVIPPLGSSYFLPRIIGLAQAKALVLSGKLLDGNDALRIGLVHQVSSENALMEDAQQFLKPILANAQLSLGLAKDLLNRSFERHSIAEALQAEQEAFAACCDGEEKRQRIDLKVRKKPKGDG